MIGKMDDERVIGFDRVLGLSELFQGERRVKLLDGRRVMRRRPFVKGDLLVVDVDIVPLAARELAFEDDDEPVLGGERAVVSPAVSSLIENELAPEPSSPVDEIQYSELCSASSGGMESCAAWSTRSAIPNAIPYTR